MIWELEEVATGQHACSLVDLKQWLPWVTAGVKVLVFDFYPGYVGFSYEWERWRKAHGNTVTGAGK